MKVEIASEVHRLMNRLCDLKKEKSELKISSADLAALKEKLGERCVLMAVSDIRKAIENDIVYVQKELNEYVGCRAYDIESKLRVSMLRLVEDVFDKLFGGYHNLPHEQRIIIGQMVEDRVIETIKKLK